MQWLLPLRRHFRPSDDLGELMRETVEESARSGLRLIPIVEGDECLVVASLLARGELTDAAKLVPPAAWMPVQPMYG